MNGVGMLSTRRALAAVVSAVTLLTASACGSADEDAGATKVEVFTWWAEGGEKAGLDALVGRFTTDCPGHEFENGVVAGGAGVNAKQVLGARIEQNDPPDTFQVHAGAELADYIAAGRVQDLSGEYDSWGLRQAFPQGLIDDLTVAGKIYSVPSNVHRANVVWANSQVLSDAGIVRTPKTLDAFLKDLATLRRAGVESPLALGRDWTQLMLLESVLISGLGPKRFAGLFTGDTKWQSRAVRDALADYAQLISFSNPDRDALDWPQAEQLLIDGRAGYQLMGDWLAADLAAKNFRAYESFTFPGTDGVFQWLADSFVLPAGATNAEGTRCWLKTVASAEGQREFNIRKGSIPARTDVTGDGFSAYQVAAMKDWESDTPVPSCAHGSACSQDWQNALNAALGAFSTAPEKNVTALQNALAATAAQYVKG
ncbi:ABC transporter substrate-binding protein [Actinoplanes sp. NPDC024001]|uniref:ABC transporter substrate-binding protein n=1 Tax=Actinoplanes sp. NPDC024001 TaxID=3154598 RepID=UPI0033C400D8